MQVKCSTDFVMDCIRKIYATDRWYSSDKMRETCRTVEAIMRQIGLTEVKTLRYPSDGHTSYGGWVMPLCWDAREATLEIAAPEVQEPLLCQYSKTPCCLMLNSRSADITAEVVIHHKGQPLPSPKGKFVFVTEQWPTMEMTIDWCKQGAVGVIGSVLGGNHVGKKGFECLNDSCQWYNYVIPHWPLKEKPFGFSLTPNQAARLSALLQRDARLRLRARVDTRLYPGTIPLVTGFLKGETSEEIVITAHLFEQGANDNASGVSLALGIARALMKQKLKRGIRLMFTYEARSLQAYLNTKPSCRRMLAGINMDMVGVSKNKIVAIGGGRPVMPNYTVPLLQSFFRKHPGYTTTPETGFGAIDNAFGEPLIGVPIPCILLWDDPNYHKSTDFPEYISPSVLKTVGSAVGQYVTFLANAGYPEARKLARLVYDTEKARLDAMTGNQSFALEQARQSLASIRRIMAVAGKNDDPEVHTAQKEALNRLIESLAQKLALHCKPVTESPAPVIPEADALRRLIPRKMFKGFFSFEKYLGCNKSGLEPIRDVVKGWSAAAWVNYALMWSDGKRTALDILQMLLAWKPDVSPQLFGDLLRFMEKEGYLKITRRLAGKSKTAAAKR